MPDGQEVLEPAYRGHPFGLTWEGRYVAGISKVSVLTPTFQTITLERGVTHDHAFVQWIDAVLADRSSVLDPAHGDNGSAQLRSSGLGKDVVLTMYDEKGQKVIAYHIYGCCPSAFITLPDFRRDAMAFSILRLEYSRWEAEARRPV